MMRGWLRRLPWRLYMLCLCGVYLFFVFMFHGKLQRDLVQERLDAQLSIHHFHHTYNSSQHVVITSNISVQLVAPELPTSIVYADRKLKAAADDSLKLKKKYVSNHEKCANYDAYSLNQRFQALDDGGAYVFSAYLDTRYNDTRIVRIMSILSREKLRINHVTCHFYDDAGNISVSATLYEMCENHNKIMGGFILSCVVPERVINVCQVTLTIIVESKNVIVYSPPSATREVTVNVTDINADEAAYDYGICIPPLFGSVKTELLVEFIEFSRVLGAEHFIFYSFHITDNEMQRVLSYYSKKRVVTVVPWNLPTEIEDSMIWYHGQLVAHNDCLYRAMNLIKLLAIQDIDEYIVPHNGNKYWPQLFPSLQTNATCGYSFSSAFYDPKAGRSHPSGLITMGHTGKTKQFSHVRTKVMVYPSRIFEVGIHHVSKPALELYEMKRVDPAILYLHHYRKCIGNYGMKCDEFEPDRTAFRYFDELWTNFDMAMTAINQTLF